MTPQDFDEFVESCWMGGTQPLDQQIAITALGLSGESSEVMEKILVAAQATVAAGNHAERIKKVIRGDDPKPNHFEEIGKELGDILFYVSNQARLHGMSLEEIMDMNVDKLSNRISHGTLRGDGDDR